MPITETKTLYIRQCLTICRNARCTLHTYKYMFVCILMISDIYRLCSQTIHIMCCSFVFKMHFSRDIRWFVSSFRYRLLAGCAIEHMDCIVPYTVVFLLLRFSWLISWLTRTWFCWPCVWRNMVRNMRCASVSLSSIHHQNWSGMLTHERLSKYPGCP